jgi:S-adenosylmethionine decarboxylase
MLDLAHCTIIGNKSNTCFDSFVLSESSLFVFPFKIILKTCGTTTLLEVVPKLLEFATRFNLALELVMFSRKNFLFPDVQVFPHTCWQDEGAYLSQYFDGQSYILGPLTNDHWYLWLADYSDSDCSSSNKDLTLEIMMHNLDRNAALNFYRTETTQDTDKFPGIADLIPGSDTDEFNFTPCGYSMNGLLEDVYSTIHVTPEPHCSYASYETNISLPTYKKLCASVFEIFKPGTVTLTLFAQKMNASVLSHALDMKIAGYVLKHKTVSEIGENSEVVLCNYEKMDVHDKQRKRPFYYSK